MIPKNLFFLFGIMYLLSIVHACTIKNMTCSAIQTSIGFKLLFKSIMTALEMEVTQNGTIIATSKLGKFNFSTEVVHMDKNSITTHKCHDLQFTSIIEKKGGLISESCVIFKVFDDTCTEKKEHQYSAALITAAGLGAVIFVTVLGYIPWKKKREKKGEGVSFGLYLKYIRQCSCFRKGHCDVKANYKNSTDNIQDDNTHNYEIGLRDEAEADIQNTDNAIDMNSDVASTNDYISVSVVSEGCIHQGMNGNMGLDPGGGWASKNHSNGNRRTLGAQSPEGQKAKGPPSPQKQRSAKSEFEERAEEATELVNSLGPGSKSTTPPHDVEKGLA